ncbi:hypothetical protein DOK_15409 [gamma proteobacterium BDW918]|jgi:hypothetical protein|uniref:Bacterial collagen-like protein middle domain-containing protein n=1 Tax=Zhongshania aliphaticivorans TaxID=1470434 RepID=A0A127M8Y5_9GAMM|nr:hypothetical protein [Zhongshania aliphaticivorans]AMO69690.1 hypothetical protein AZF00_15900 [Zhongshania aliphaticivorans]EIF42355.1 hypothetical protein DOK_15409 [gamma proteobacterium BDW918]
MKCFSGKTLLAVSFGASLALTACGGGGSSKSGKTTSEEEQPVTSSYSEVEGPLDVVQQPLSEQVITQLAGAAAGTPLEGAINCVGGFVVTDVLDILDSVLVQVDPATLLDPAALLANSASGLQASVTELATDLPAALASLTGASCTGGSAGESGSNPLAGTPLAPLGDALAPVFAAASGGGSSGGDAPSAAALMQQLSTAFSEGLATVMAQDQVADAPILGGLLVTLNQAFSDLAVTVAALETMDPDITGAAVTSTVNNLLDNVLTKVVPIAFIEEQAGQGPVLSSQIEAAVASLTGLLGGDLSGLTAGDFTSLFGAGAGDLFAPLSDTVLGGLQSAITGALAGGGSSGTTGTPLDAVLDQLAPIQAALSAQGGSGLTGTPLDVLLAPVASALQGGGACPLATTPLAAVCDVVGDLQSALTLNPSADPLAVLQGLLESILGIFSNR